MDINRAGFGKEERLKSQKKIEQLFKEGHSFSIPPYRTYFLLEPLNNKKNPARETLQPPHPLQVGFGASSKYYKSAVARNRIKRVTREAFRLQKAPLISALQKSKQQLCLFLIYSGQELPSYADVSKKIEKIIEKLRLKTDEDPANDH